MRKRPKGRHSVYVGEIPTQPGDPEFFWPESIVDLSDRIENVKLLESDLTLCQAASLVRQHNEIQFARGIPDGLWAFVVIRLKGGRPNSTTKGQIP